MKKGQEDSQILKKGQPVVAVGASGALSSGRPLPYWQMPAALAEAFARRALEGNLPKDGRDPYPIHNWRKGLGDREFIRDRFDHFFKHVLKFMNGVEDDEDDLQGNVDAMCWFAGFIAEAAKKHPEVVKECFYGECREEIYHDAVKAAGATK